ncbi:MAG: T9SS type A sorting domain-containing protein [Ignavibacterium sp.]|nr:T9SS type A sorting domain-containing protein [Ignavibacterium sp.]
MKNKIVLVFLLTIVALNAQSVITLSAGTTIEIGTGADLCAGSIEGSGQLLGSGTFCGNPTGVESKDDIKLPTEFALGQNYPNPFNPSTIISFQLPVSSNATLKVYDVLGNEVATLLNEYREAGKYEVVFDASFAGGGLSSGIYIYKLQAANNIFTKKMTIIK